MTGKEVFSSNFYTSLDTLDNFEDKSTKKFQKVKVADNKFFAKTTQCFSKFSKYKIRQVDSMESFT